MKKIVIEALRVIKYRLSSRLTASKLFIVLQKNINFIYYFVLFMIHITNTLLF